jgi:hypothetical protein
MNLENYYLDIRKVNKLEEQDRRTIHDYYRDMLFSKEDNKNTVAVSLFNTLVRNKFLISIRNEKIDEIIDGDKTVNN